MRTRVALITGASRGIGLEVARLFLSDGWKVALTGRSGERLEQAAAELDRPGAVMLHGGSVTDAEHRQVAVASTVERFGRLDALVNCAGVNPFFGPLLEQDDDSVRGVIDANLIAPLAWIREAARAWQAEHGGSVVNVASIAGLRAQRGLGAYAVSKAALIHLTRQLALELAPAVRVNAVAPALVRTRFAAALWSEREPELLGHYPLGRLGEPLDVARAVVFLAGDGAAWITGQTVVLDGGLLSDDPVNEANVLTA
jgi:3-oxoacyl-[acyl-carrier protein] reductase